MKRSWIALALFSMLLCSCSTWVLKEKCQATNWFEYSQKVAYQGKYLEEDGFIKDCRGVDRINDVQLDLGFKLGREKMCTYDEIYKRATQGQPVFFKFCDGLEAPLMKKRYQDGLNIFCTNDQGYSYGKSGQDYLKVCPAQQEVQFLPGYYRGRFEYLTQFLIDKRELESKQLGNIQSYSQSESNASRAYSSIPNLLDCNSLQVYNEATKQNENRTVCSEPFYIRSQRESLYSEMSSASSSLSQARAAYADTVGKIQWAEHELAIIPHKTN